MLHNFFFLPFVRMWSEVAGGLVLSLFCLVFLSGVSFAAGLLNLPEPLPPENYGDVMINRTSDQHDVAPVFFPHWIHRVKYTCRVCHFELEFSMKANETPIVCDNGKMNGKFCAACHNGKVSFGPTDEAVKNCRRCHRLSPNPDNEEFMTLQKKLPKGRLGNGIDWSRALDEGFIKPAKGLSSAGDPINIDKTLTLSAEMSGISSAVFPHKTHEQWLDCSNCHPDLFNIKKKTTKDLRMSNMVKGESCGLCHLRVSFPLDDCKRCHPKMRSGF